MGLQVQKEMLQSSTWHRTGQRSSSPVVGRTHPSAEERCNLETPGLDLKTTCDGEPCTASSKLFQ